MTTPVPEELKKDLVHINQSVQLTERYLREVLNEVKKCLRVCIAEGNVTLNAQDIQIGAVELKDQDSNTRADIEQDVSKNALYVQSESLLAKLEEIRVFADSLDSKDFSTETTLISIKGLIDDVESLLTTLTNKDFATETTLAGLKTVVEGIKAQTDKLTFIIDRLKVDAAITATIETDIRTLAQKLAEEDKMFVSTLDFVSLGKANETDAILMRNPVGSGKSIRIRDFIFISSKAMNPASIRIYRNPTVTSTGTSVAINNLRDSSVASSINIFKLPTISAKGTLLQVFGLVGQGELRHEEFMQMFLLEGEDLLITIEPNSSNQKFAIDITWGEE